MSESELNTSMVSTLSERSMKQEQSIYSNSTEQLDHTLSYTGEASLRTREPDSDQMYKRSDDQLSFTEYLDEKPTFVSSYNATARQKKENEKKQKQEKPPLVDRNVGKISVEKYRQRCLLGRANVAPYPGVNRLNAVRRTQMITATSIVPWTRPSVAVPNPNALNNTSTVETFTSPSPSPRPHSLLRLLRSPQPEVQQQQMLNYPTVTLLQPQQNDEAVQRPQQILLPQVQELAQHLFLPPNPIEIRNEATYCYICGQQYASKSSLYTHKRTKKHMDNVKMQNHSTVHQ